MKDSKSVLGIALTSGGLTQVLLGAIWHATRTPITVSSLVVGGLMSVVLGFALMVVAAIRKEVAR